MSVVKSQRGENDLTVITKARELAVYTIQICTNEQNFPKRYRWCTTNDIVKSANEIHRNIRKANEIYVKDENDYKIRKDYQNRALAEIGGLLGDMDIAFAVFKVDPKRLKNRINFLGFSHKLTQSGKVIRKILPENVKDERRKLRKLHGLVDIGILTKDDVNKCFEAWKSHAEKGDTYTLVREVDQFYKSLWEVQIVV